MAAGRDDLRLVPVEALHLTLAFLGHLPEAHVPLVWQATVAAAAGLGAPPLAPAGVRGVPPRRPRLFALDLLDPSGACSELQARVSHGLTEAGLYEPERRPFWPHVTLARVQGGRRAAPLGEVAAIPSFRAQEVTLYRSRLSPSGARYEPLERLALPG